MTTDVFCFSVTKYTQINGANRGGHFYKQDALQDGGQRWRALHKSSRTTNLRMLNSSSFPWTKNAPPLPVVARMASINERVFK